MIKDPKVHKAVLKDVLSFAQEQGLGVLGLERSPIKGPKGNVEFLAYIGIPKRENNSLGRMIARVT